MLRLWISYVWVSTAVADPGFARPGASTRVGGREGEVNQPIIWQNVLPNATWKQWPVQDFPEVGGANSKGGCEKLLFSHFPPKLLEIKRIWTQRGMRLWRPLRSANGKWKKLDREGHPLGSAKVLVCTKRVNTESGLGFTSKATSVRKVKMLSIPQGKSVVYFNYDVMLSLLF